jgi:GDPmannose 4,6-dehydratase
MFGKVREVPQNEDTAFYPRSPYGISKVVGFELTRNYREAYEMFCAAGILFNHESPRRGHEFVTRKISSTVARIKQPEPDDYVVATGEAHSVAEFCERAFSQVGLDYRKYVVTDENFRRPAEVDQLVGDAAKAKTALGWNLEYSFDELVSEMVEYDLKVLSAS